MWKYVPLLNVMIQILFTIGLGGVMGKLGILKAEEFVPLAVRFVFYVALPCLVIKVSLLVSVFMFYKGNSYPSHTLLTGTWYWSQLLQ